MTSWRTETVSVTRGRKAEPFDFRLLLQPSVSGVDVSRSYVRAHPGHFEHILWSFGVQCAKLTLIIFLIWGFIVLLLYLSPKCNLSETF